MAGLAALATRGVAIGLGATAFVDIVWTVLHRVFGVAPVHWGMVGRWVGHMRHGHFVQDSIGAAPPVPGETALGWGVHYAIGALYGVLLVFLCGAAWVHEPTALPALVLSWALLVAPWLVMMPGMGFGVAARKTPNPALLRIRSIASHTLFGLGLYVSARVLAALVPMA